MTKVLMINGSPDVNGCVHTAFEIIRETLEAHGTECQEIIVGNRDIRGCIGCRTCKKNGKCVFDDLVNETAGKLKEADGVIIGSPVYYGNPNGTVLSFVQRLFYSCGLDLHMKVGASVVSCRRGGNSAVFEALNQFFTISGMPVASSTYWNDVHGYSAEDVYADEEGVQTMRNLAENMQFLMDAIGERRKTVEKPEMKREVHTHFIRG